MELSGNKYDQQLDRSILVMMMVLRMKICAKTRDLTSKSLVDNNAEDVESIRYIALCMDVAEKEYKQIATHQSTD